MRRRLIILGSLLVVSTGVGRLTCKNFPADDHATSERVAKGGISHGLLKQISDERIVAVHRWHVEDGGEKSLLCVFTSFDSDSHYEGKGVRLSILEPSGTSIYDAYFTELHRVYSLFALLNLSEQLVMEIDYGGSTEFLRMLDYRDGKVVNLIDEKESDFDIGAEVRPQFRRGINPGAEPLQIMLTRGVGLASPARKYTSVYRYQNGKYRHFGDFSQQEVDDHIENLLTHVTRRKNQE
jgi:hypothetical protein